MSTTKLDEKVRRQKGGADIPVCHVAADRKVGQTLTLRSRAKHGLCRIRRSLSAIKFAVSKVGQTFLSAIKFAVSKVGQTFLSAIKFAVSKVGQTFLSAM
jgi:hypothetical protein